MSDDTARATPSQLDKFKEAARELETDDDPKRFKEGLGESREPSRSRRSRITDLEPAHS
jgi:hypothetical protein